MSDSRNFVTRIVASTGCVLLILIAAGGLPIARTFLASALFSVLLMYIAARPHLHHLALIALVTPAIVMFHQWLWFGFSMPSYVLVLGGLGVATFLVLMLQLVWSDIDDRREILQILIPAAILTVMLFCTHNLLSLAGRFTPKTLDLYLLSFDGTLGLQPSFWMGRMFHEHRWFGIIGSQAYFAILLAMGASYVLHSRRREQGVSRYFMLEAFLAAGILGFVFYQLFPAAGPGYAFPADFPFGGIPAEQMSRLLVEPIPLKAEIARNAIPSLHMTWALLIWLNLRRASRLLAVVSAIFVLLTVTGTLGSGEHYLVDLVVAFPFTLAIQAIVSRHVPLSDSRRFIPIIVGLAGTLAWIAALRFALKMFWISPVLPWTAIAISIAGSIYLSLPLLTTRPRMETAPAPAPAASQVTVA